MGYFFALLPPFLDSAINYVDKFLLSKYPVRPAILAIYSGTFAFFTGCIVFLLTGLHIIPITNSFVIIVSGFFSLFYLLIYFKALQLDEASRVASLFQFSPVLVLLLSFVFLHETLTAQQYIGCFCIIIAGFLFAVRRLDNGLIRVNKAFWYMLFACLLFAVLSILFKSGVETINFWQALPYEGLGNGIAVLAIVFLGRNFQNLEKTNKKMPRKVFVSLAISEIIYRLSQYSYYFALFLLSAAIVSVLQGFQSFFLLVEGVILSLWFPKIIEEVVTKKTVGIKLVATCGIIVGLSLIFL